MDEKYLEMADDFTTRLIESGISSARKKAIIPDNFDGNCSCGELIPTERVSSGYYSCVECQTAFERRGKYFR